MAARAGDRSAAPVYLAGTVSAAKSRPLVYLALKQGQVASEVTGAMTMRYLAEPDNIQTVIHDQIDTTLEAQMPLGYLIPAAWKQIADLLALHGVEMERTTKPLTQEFETYRFSGVTWSNGPQEGHIMLGNFDARLVKEKMTISEGSYWVPMKQRRARLILATLEPLAPDSFARWGLMYQVFEGGGRGGRGGAGRGGALIPESVMPGEYLSEPIARKTMADNPDLAKEFLAKVASDPTFAADRTARLQWWYQHSKYEPSDNGRYPIVRVWEKNW
jgi:hypothetical protein